MIFKLVSKHYSDCGFPQDGPDPKMARLAAEMACSLHAHGRFLCHSGRALLRRQDRKANPPRRLPLDGGIGNCNPRLYVVVSADPKPFQWTKSADDLLVVVKRFCLKRLDLAPAQTEIETKSESGY